MKLLNINKYSNINISAIQSLQFPLVIFPTGENSDTFMQVNVSTEKLSPSCYISPEQILKSVMKIRIWNNLKTKVNCPPNRIHNDKKNSLTIL